MSTNFTSNYILLSTSMEGIICILTEQHTEEAFNTKVVLLSLRTQLFPGELLTNARFSTSMIDSVIK